MAVYVRMEDSKRPVKDTRSWKYYVFILVGLLILIPVAMIFYNSVLKRNKMRILSTISRAPQWTSVPKEHKTREISGPVGNNSFDFLLFTQCYPITNCITTQSSMDKCHFAPDWEAWTIHGIWPSDNGSMGPQFCKNVKFDVAVLDDIINDLDIHWYSTQPNGNENFWAHEWKKHGSCAEQLTPFDSELKYFSQGLSWNKEFNVNDMLEAHSIRPNNSRTYKTEEFENAIEAEIGVKPVLHCSSDKKNHVSLLSEIRLCFTKNKQLVTCENREELSDCPQDGFIYPESTYSTERF